MLSSASSIRDFNALFYFDGYKQQSVAFRRLLCEWGGGGD
jgi:hypothetical protein